MQGREMDCLCCLTSGLYSQAAPRRVHLSDGVPGSVRILNPLLRPAINLALVQHLQLGHFELVSGLSNFIQPYQPVAVASLEPAARRQREVPVERDDGPGGVLAAFVKIPAERQMSVLEGAAEGLAGQGESLAFVVAQHGWGWG